MNNSILLRWLNVALCGLAAVAIYGCGDETEGGGSAGTGSTSTGGASTSTGSGSTGTGSTGTGSDTTSSTSASTGTGAGADAALIDDMEDGDSAIASSEGRLGYWYTFNDMTGTQTPAADAFTMESLPTPRDGSTKAAHTTGTGFKTYAGIGFNFKLSGTEKTAYDASGYTGITFWAKKAPTSIAKVRVTLPDVNTDPLGKVCTAAGCYDHFGKDLTLTDEWTEFTIPFADLAQIGFGDPKPAGIDPKQVYGIQFQVEAAMMDFDYWIDDISFTK